MEQVAYSESTRQESNIHLTKQKKIIVFGSAQNHWNIKQKWFFNKVMETDN